MMMSCILLGSISACINVFVFETAGESAALSLFILAIVMLRIVNESCSLLACCPCFA